MGRAQSMVLNPEAGAAQDHEAALIARAQQNDHDAFESLVEPVRRSLFAYILRMVAHRQDAEDLFQDTLIRALRGIGNFKGESRFKSWIFTIATNACLDHLRRRKRWRAEAQLEGEKSCNEDAGAVARVESTMADPEFSFEIQEHIAFCFSCVARTLEPEQQAALMLREVFEFSVAEAAKVMGVSQPVFGHRLASARKAMIGHFDGLCALVGKTGACWQCRALREFAPEDHRGPDLVQIEVGPGLAATPENLLDARIALVRDADLENGRTSSLHNWFFAAFTRQEEEGAPFR